MSAYFGGEAGSIVLPRYNLKCFQVFLAWVVLDANRAVSLPGVVIAASSLMTKLNLTDLTKCSTVKETVKELISNANYLPRPQTISTRRIIVELLNMVLPHHLFGYLLPFAFWGWSRSNSQSCTNGFHHREPEWQHTTGHSYMSRLDLQDYVTQ